MTPTLATPRERPGPCPEALREAEGGLESRRPWAPLCPLTAKACAATVSPFLLSPEGHTSSPVSIEAPPHCHSWVYCPSCWDLERPLHS